jgi:DNA-binding transcriptional LysR family regulator
LDIDLISGHDLLVEIDQRYQSSPESKARQMFQNNFNDMMAFLAVAEERSFTRAANRLGVAQSTLSAAMKRLEERLGLRLLNRTTRSVTPTEPGARLLAALHPRISELDEEISALMEYREKPAGIVRITLSSHALDWCVWSRLEPVLRQFPDLRVEFSTDTAFVDIVSEGFDAGVRLGESIEKDMIAVRISPDWRLVAVASPSYFARHSPPEHPRDLLQHTCIPMRHSRHGGIPAWEFSKDGEDVRVRAEGQLVFGASAALLDAVRDGYGVAYLPEDMVVDRIAKGEFRQVLDDWSPRFEGYFLYFPSRRQALPAFRVVVDALRCGGGGAPPGFERSRPAR